MLTFFRRIRRGFLSNDATSKYLLYAIGEIALVVIGILIALQVNNWNQNRLDARMEQSFLLRLERDLQEDINQLEELIDFADETIAISPAVIDDLYGTKRTIEDVFVLSDRSNGIWVPDFVPNDATYKELESSGQLNLIRSEKLREALIDIVKIYQQDVEWRSLINDWLVGVIRELDTHTKMIKYNEFTRSALKVPEYTPPAEWQVLNDTESREFDLVENTIVSRLWIVQQKKMRYTGLIDECEVVLRLVKDQIR